MLDTTYLEELVVVEARLLFAVVPIERLAVLRLYGHPGGFFVDLVWWAL